MCVNPLKNPLSGIGLASKAGSVSPVGGAGLMKSLIRKKRTGNAVAVDTVIN